jgi:peptidyl-prolyl cis-trans isomerase B (cyclophilin B)
MSNVSKPEDQRQRGLAFAMTFLCGLWLPASNQAQAPPVQERPLVEIRTIIGNMVVALYNETPVHRDRFLQLVQDGAYDSLLFHRVVPGFVVEGGDPASKHAPPGLALGMDTDAGGLPLEIAPGLIHKRGALAAAAAGDTPELAIRSHGMRFYLVQGVDYTAQELDLVMDRNKKLGQPFPYSEADRQAYITQGGTPRLDGAYTVFGEVVEGQDVIDAMALLPCNEWDRPMSDIRMHMRIVK